MASSRAEPEQKQEGDARDDELELALLTALFIRWYVTAWRAVHTMVVKVFNLGPIPLDDPAIQKAVLAAQAEAAVVDATTRRLIVDRIVQGLQRGLTPAQIANGTPEFAGIDGLFEVTWKNRPLTVANTVIQKAVLQATIERYRQLGKGVVTHLLIHDGDYDGYCEARNGTTVSINAAPDLAHPNCRLSVTPVFGDPRQ